jgi:hypothetical protein
MKLSKTVEVVRRYTDKQNRKRYGVDSVDIEVPVSKRTTRKIDRAKNRLVSLLLNPPDSIVFHSGDIEYVG